MRWLDCCVERIAVVSVFPQFIRFYLLNFSYDAGIVSLSIQHHFENVCWLVGVLLRFATFYCFFFHAYIAIQLTWPLTNTRRKMHFYICFFILLLKFTFISDSYHVADVFNIFTIGQFSVTTFVSFYISSTI